MSGSTQDIYAPPFCRNSHSQKKGHLQNCRKEQYFSVPIDHLIGNSSFQLDSKKKTFLSKNLPKTYVIQTFQPPILVCFSRLNCSTRQLGVCFFQVSLARGLSWGLTPISEASISTTRVAVDDHRCQ